MYIQSELTGEIRNELGIIIPQDDSTILWNDFDKWKKDGGVIQYVEYFDGEIEEKYYNDSLKIETERYVKRANDGCLAYAEISAEFRLAKLNGIISEEAHSVIEKTLIPVRNEVLAGQWISAKNELILLGSSVIGVDLYDRLLNQITEYISDNY